MYLNLYDYKLFVPLKKKEEGRQLLENDFPTISGEMAFLGYVIWTGQHCLMK